MDPVSAGVRGVDTGLNAPTVPKYRPERGGTFASGRGCGVTHCFEIRCLSLAPELS